MNLGEMVVSFAADLSKLTSGISQAKSQIASIGSVAQSTGKSIGGGFMGAAGGLLDFGSKLGMTVIGVQGLAQGVVGLGSALVSGNASMESATVSFNAFTGSVETTEKLLKQLSTFAATTPFAFPEIQNASLSLLNMGVATEDVQTHLTDLGNAVAKVSGNGQMLEEVTAIIAQMGMKGKITNEEMLQLTERNIKAFPVLAEAMGVSVEELQEMASKGELGADKIDLLVKSLGKWGNGAMIEQGKTFNGLLSSLIDNFNSAVNTLTKPLFDLSKSGLQALGDFLQGESFKSFASTTGQQIAAVFQRLSEWGGKLGEAFKSDSFQKMASALGGLGNTISTVLAPVLEPVKQALIDMFSNKGAAEGATMLKDAFDGIGQAASGLSGFIRMVADGFAAAQPYFVQIGAFLVETFTPVWNQLVQTFQTQLLPAWNDLVKALEPIMPTLLEIAGVIGVVLVAMIGGLVGAIAGAAQGIAKAIGGIVTFFSGFVQTISGIVALIYDLVTGKFDRLGHDLDTIFGGIGRMFSGWWQFIQGLFGAAIGWIVGYVTGFWKTLVGIFTNLFNQLVGHSIIPDLINGILRFFSTLPANVLKYITTMVSQVISAVVKFATDLVARIKTGIDGFIKNFTDMGPKVIIAVALLVKQVTDRFTAFARDAINFGRNVVQGFIDGLRSMLGAVGGVANEIAGKIAEFLPHSPAERGPLKTVDRWMPSFVDMLASGLQKGIPEIETAVNALVTPMAVDLAAPFTPSQEQLSLLFEPPVQRVIVVREEGGSAAPKQEMIIINELDGREIGRTVTRYTDGRVRSKFGVRSR